MHTNTTTRGLGGNTAEAERALLVESGVIPRQTEHDREHAIVAATETAILLDDARTATEARTIAQERASVICSCGFFSDWLHDRAQYHAAALAFGRANA